MQMEQRFWAKVDVRSADECWPWKAGRFQNGYGAFCLHGRPHQAQRVAWKLARGRIPDGLFVCHHCDNRPCCNPAHLFVGSAADNNADMVAKGRNWRGARPKRKRRGKAYPNAKLTWADVEAIRSARAAGQTLKEIACCYAISRSHVGNIIRGRFWAQLVRPGD